MVDAEKNIEGRHFRIVTVEVSFYNSKVAVSKLTKQAKNTNKRKFKNWKIILVDFKSLHKFNNMKDLVKAKLKKLKLKLKLKISKFCRIY